MRKNLFINEENRSGIEEVDQYIEMLEAVIKDYYSDNSGRLVYEANRVIGILADDLESIAETGDIKNTKIIKAEKNNMLMDRIVKMLTQVDSMTSISKKAVNAGKAAQESIKKESGLSIPEEKIIQHEALNEPEDEEEYEGVNLIEEIIKAKQNK